MTDQQIINILEDISWNSCSRYDKEVMVEVRKAAINTLQNEDNK